MSIKTKLKSLMTAAKKESNPYTKVQEKINRKNQSTNFDDPETVYQFIYDDKGNLRNFVKNLPRWGSIEIENEQLAYLRPATSIKGLKVPAIETAVSLAGKPIILFHASANRFTKFKGNNHFFSTDPLVALSFIDPDSTLVGGGRTGEKPTLYAVVVTVSKLLDAAKPPKGFKLIDSTPDDLEAIRVHKETDYDGIVWRKIKDANHPADIYHISNPKQITIIKTWPVVMRDNLGGTRYDLTEQELNRAGFKL